MISLNHVSFSYHAQKHGGLQDVSLTVKKGECILLCGRSGCGKTTLTRLINGLIPKFYPGELSGSVLVDGRNIAEQPMYETAEQVGSVFQNPRTQFFNVDTDSEIAFGLESQARPPDELRRRVSETATKLGIQHLRRRSLHQLSGGEKQKIAFASVYAMNPDIYLLDEPSSNLDMDAIQNLKEYLSLIKQQGKTILIAEHRLYYLMDIADRILYLEEGRIEGIYTPAQLKQLPQQEREGMGLRVTDLQTIHPVSAQTNMPAPLLELRDVALHYKKHPVLEGISLSAGSGEVIGVIGHNGAGKTTFTRALCGLHKNSEGQFIWNMYPLNQKARLKRSYMVMQDVNYELFAESVEQECSFGIRNPDKALVESTLEKLGLSSCKAVHPNALSGGQKQRVAVAVSMICGKELLVFDEPTSGLDFDSMAQVASLVKELAAMGKLILIVTHDYEFVCRTCSRVLHIEQGRLQDDLTVSFATEGHLKKLFSVKEERFYAKQEKSH